jgi:hypothetical protein
VKTALTSAILFLLVIQATYADDPSQHWPKGECTAKNVVQICEGSTDWMIGLYKTDGLRWGLLRGSSASEVQKILEERREFQTMVAAYSKKDPCQNYSDNYCNPTAPYCRKCFPNIRYGSQNTEAEQIKERRTLNRLNQWSEKVDRAKAPFKELNKQVVEMIEKEGLKALIQRAPNIGRFLEQASEAQKKIEEIYSAHEDFIRLNELSMESIDDLMSDAEDLSNEIDALEAAYKKISDKEKNQLIEKVAKLFETMRPAKPAAPGPVATAPARSTPSTPSSARQSLTPKQEELLKNVRHHVRLNTPRMVRGYQVKGGQFDDRGQWIDQYNDQGAGYDYTIWGTSAFAYWPKGDHKFYRNGEAFYPLYSLANAVTGTPITEPKYISFGPVFGEGLIQFEGGKLNTTAPDRKYFESIAFGFIDANGKEVVPPQYKDVGYPSEGLIPVFDETWKYLNLSGKLVLETDYTSATGFVNGRALVGRRNSKGVYENYLIDPKGRKIKDAPQGSGLSGVYFINGKQRLPMIRSASIDSSKVGIFDAAYEEWLVRPEMNRIYQGYSQLGPSLSSFFILEGQDGESIYNRNFQEIYKIPAHEEFFSTSTPQIAEKWMTETRWRIVYLRSKANPDQENRGVFINLETGEQKPL